MISLNSLFALFVASCVTFNIIFAAEVAPPNLAMQVIYTSGPCSIFGVDYEHPMVDGRTPSQPMHHLKITSANGYASLQIQPGQGGQVEVKHTGTSWAIILDPAEGIEVNTVYPPKIAGQTFFRPTAIPDGADANIKKDGYFIIVVPVIPERYLYIKPTDLLGSFIGLDSTDVKSVAEMAQNFIEKYIKLELITFVIGRFVHSPRPVLQIADQSSGHAASNHDLSSVMQGLKRKQTCPFTFGDISTINFQNIVAANVGTKTNQLAFATEDGVSSAGVQIDLGEGGQLRLSYAQSGQANVFVLRPSEKRFIFPNITELEGLNFGRYFAFESPMVKVIDEPLKVGDVVVMVIPIIGMDNWDVKMCSLTKLLMSFARKPDILESENLSGPMIDSFDMPQASQAFISFCTVQKRGPPVVPFEAIPTSIQWSKIQGGTDRTETLNLDADIINFEASFPANDNDFDSAEYQDVSGDEVDEDVEDSSRKRRRF